MHIVSTSFLAVVELVNKLNKFALRTIELLKFGIKDDNFSIFLLQQLFK